MPSRKRTHAEASADEPNIKPKPSLLSRIRNRWEFAALYSFIYIFGDALKIDKEIDIDLLEEECLKPEPSLKLAELGLLLLKQVSSHRGLTLELFDEYTRRQYVAKAPHRNPYGEDEEPKQFNDFDVFTKLRVLYQLSVWTLWNPDKLRERMEEKDSQQTIWRIEHDGEDSRGRKYFVLDDNRLYRWTDAPLPAEPMSAAVVPPKPKKRQPKVLPKATPGVRQSKRQKLLRADTPPDESQGESDAEDDVRINASVSQQHDANSQAEYEEQEGLDGARWECLAVTLEEYNDFLDSLSSSRNRDEKALAARIRDKALPTVEASFEAQARKAAARARELATLEKMAYAKRSTRISARHEKEKEEQQHQEAERRHREELAMAHREQDRLAKIERDRESRMVTRDQRLREREMKRILHEEELAKLERASEDDDAGRMSERNRLAQLQRQKEELALLEQATEDWDFDCAICGVHGKNLDDGSHILQCEQCSVWQHSKCHGLTPQEAEADDFHFVCASCSRSPHAAAPVGAHAEISIEPAPPVPAGSDGHKTQARPHKPAKPRKSAEDQANRQQEKHRKQSTTNGGSDGSFAVFENHTPASYASHSRPVSTPVSKSSLSAVEHKTPANGNSLSRSQQQHTTPANDNSISRSQQQHTTPANGSSLSLSQQQHASPANGSLGVAASPAPELKATEGNTSVRFSPNHGHSATRPSQSYSPTLNRPVAAALSPTKQPSPSSSSSFQVGSSQQQSSQGSQGSQSPQYGSTKAGSIAARASAMPMSSPPPPLSQESQARGIVPPSPDKWNPAPLQASPIPPLGPSPSKHSSPASSQVLSQSTQQLQHPHTEHDSAAGILPSSPSQTLSYEPVANPSETPAKVSLPPGLALSPSVNVGLVNQAPPTKKAVAAPTAPPGQLDHASLASSSSSFPGRDENIRSGSTPAVPSSVVIRNGAIVDAASVDRQT